MKPFAPSDPAVVDDKNEGGGVNHVVGYYIDIACSIECDHSVSPLSESCAVDFYQYVSFF